MLKKIIIILVLILWPINLILNLKGLHFSIDTVFKNDYQGEQLVLRNIHLYPDIVTARIFQNKPRIYINKYIGNVLTLADPNYYFFGLHPEPINGSLNLFKYPFLSIIFFIIGIFNISKSKFKKPILVTLVLFILFVSALSRLEGFDFLLWFPISLTIINGVNLFQKNNPKAFNYFCLVFIIFAIPEILRIFYIAKM